MRKLVRSIMIVGILLSFVSVGPVFAAKGGNSDNTSFLNGKPFATLNADIQVNASGIEALQAETAYLQTTVNGLTISLGNLEDTVQLNSDAITELQNDLDATNLELQGLKTQVNNHITSVNLSIAALQGQIDDLQGQVDTLTANLALQLAGLQDAIDANETNISGLLTNVATLTAQVLVVNNTLDNHESRLQDLEGKVIVIETAMVQIEVRLLSVEGVMHSHDDGLCLSFVNTAAEDVTDNDWFDTCVAAAENGGSSIRVALKDQTGNVVYEATGQIVGAWTQDHITASSTSSQWNVDLHDQRITLDNGDLLVISGKSASNGGWMGSHGNGYGIRIYSSNPGYAANFRLIVYPYKQYVGWTSARSFADWSTNKEITWHNGNLFTTNPSTPPFGSGFHGTFEFYVN